MGLCESKMKAEDRQQEKIAEFVRYAITSDLVKLREMIVKRKMDPNSQDRFGMSAIHWASYVGELECVQELIKAGASPTATDLNGRNALHHACRKDHDEVVRYLVTTAKVDVNSRSENQDTPLHKAVRGKSVQVIEMLLKLGGDPCLRNDQNRTPLEELEATWPALTTSNNRSNSEEPIQYIFNNTKPRSHDLIDVALQPVSHESNTTERTDVCSFKSRRSTTDNSDHAERRYSVSREPGQWATTPIPKSGTLTTAHEMHSNMRDAGKRVIMAMRVKSALSDAEKLELMRLLLQKCLIALEPVV